MLEHPDFFNVRKTAIALAVGPFAFLLLLVGIDFSSHQWQIWQAERSCVKVASASGIIQPGGNNCSPEQVGYASQK